MNEHLYTTAGELIAGEGQLLRGLIGQSLNATWTVWDKTSNEWFSDEFVILQFSQDCLGLNFSKFDELTVNWNFVDIQDRLNYWINCDAFDLEWRRDGNETLSKNIGRRLKDISIVEMYSKSIFVEGPFPTENIENESDQWVLTAIEFIFTDSVIAIFNAIDQNGIQEGAHVEKIYRHIPL
jgi:hypothetical protein